MVGETLRQAREAKGCTLEDAERATRIRAKHLMALEADRFADLPSETQARGFLRNYAQFLGLDAAQVMDLYTRQAGGRKLPLPGQPRPQPPRQPQAGRAPRLRSRRLRLLSADVLVGGIITLALGGLLLWGAPRLLSGTTETAASPSPAPTAAPALTATATSPAAGDFPTQPLPTPQATYVGVNLVVRAELRTWLRVVVDGNEAFTGLLPPGESMTFVGQAVVEVVSGNGQGTRVIWNGVDQGTLGGLGEVVDRLWTLEGMVIPTPTITPTPTETPPATRTPSASATARP